VDACLAPLGPSAPPRRRRWSLLIAVLAPLFGAQCDIIYPSEAEIRQEFHWFVEESNQCQDVSECVLASAGCPLGCGVAVHRDHKQAVEDKAQALISAYEKGGRHCAYKCAPAAALACTDNRCRATFGEP
jgi:hypothetical protein